MRPRTPRVHAASLACIAARFEDLACAVLLSGVLATARSVCIVHAELGEHRQRERRHRTKGRLACRCVAHTTSRVAEGGAGEAVRGVSCDRPAVRPVYNPVYRRSGAESPRLNLYTSSRKICTTL